MNFFTHENLKLYMERKQYYDANYLDKIMPLIDKYPGIFHMIYFIGQLVFFIIPMLIFLIPSDVRKAWRWKHFIIFNLIITPAGWIWNYYSVVLKQAWIFPPQYFSGIEIGGMILGDFTFYIFSTPCFYIIYSFFRTRFSVVPVYQKKQKLLSIILTGIFITIGLVGLTFFKTAGRSMFVFLYIPTTILLLIEWGKLRLPALIYMLPVGIIMEVLWDKLATTYGFWIYINGFSGIQIWKSVPLEMVYFSFASGFFISAFYELIWEVVYRKQT